MPGGIIGAADEVIERNVEVVRKGDKHIVCRLTLTELILLDSPFTGRNSKSELLLGYAPGFSQFFQVGAKIKHENTSKKILTRSNARAIIMAQHVQMRV